MAESADNIISQTLSYSFAKNHGVLVKSIENDHAIIAHRTQPKLQTIIELQRMLGKKIQLEALTDEEFENMLTLTYESDSSAAKQVVEGIEQDMDLNELIHEMPKSEDLLDAQDDAPVIKLINALLTQAVKQKASDIHVETFEARMIVRYRIDGVLHEVLEVQRVLAPLIISRLKVMAKLDIAEKRVPQDGRITLHIAGRNVDVRVSTIPSSHNERVVLRILDKKTAHLDLSLLGMFDDTLERMTEIIKSPHGIILVTGPTGSGKTTTLYAVLTDLNQVTRNIMTVEDPIEYDLPGIGQTQVSSKVNMTFAKGLRAILRQDPDVIMIGEIRDYETAEIAVHASLTGHLVLSTLHTNSAIGAITRLRDMGVEAFLLSSSLIGILAQRLVRLLCTECKEEHEVDKKEMKLLNIDAPITIYNAKGCEHCGFSGYQGRSGIYELITVDNELSNMIHSDKSEQMMDRYVRQTTPNLRTDGFRRVVSGQTTIDEVLRVTDNT